MKILVTGGIKSGKSGFALRLAGDMSGQKLFVATAEPFDDEMKARIARHQQERDPSFTTLEEPVRLDLVSGDNIVLDDITVWLGNLQHRGMLADWESILRGVLSKAGPRMIIITNETGWGNVPSDPITRAYNRVLGEANMLLSSVCDLVYVLFAGIPVRIKG